MIAPLDLAAVKARCANATEGPWSVEDDRVARPDPFFTFCVAMTHDNGVRHYVRSASEVDSVDADFDFIAHARTDVPALVAEVERLREADRKWFDDCVGLQRVIGGQRDEVERLAAENARLRAVRDAAAAYMETRGAGSLLKLGAALRAAGGG